MANKNFNKQVAPARKKLAVGGPLPRFKKKDTTDREQIIRDKILNNIGKDRPRSQDPRKKRPGSPRPLPIQPRDPRDKMTPRRPMPKLPGKPGKPGPSRPMPKLPGKTRPGPMKGLTPEQMKRLKELMQKTGRPRPKKVRKKLMGGGSSSSREAMMHGFYNKDMGMGKKKK